MSEKRTAFEDGKTTASVAPFTEIFQYSVRFCSHPCNLCNPWFNSSASFFFAFSAFFAV